MKDTAKKMILLEKKIEHSSNDIVKNVIIDGIQYASQQISGTEFARSTYAEYYDLLIQSYKDELHELKTQHKRQTKQMEITDGKDEGEDSNKTSN